MAKNSRNYSTSEIKELKITISKLKAQIRNLKKQNKTLRSDVKTLLDAWSETEEHLQTLTNDKSLEEIMNEIKS